MIYYFISICLNLCYDKINYYFGLLSIILILELHPFTHWPGNLLLMVTPALLSETSPSLSLLYVLSISEEGFLTWNVCSLIDAAWLAECFQHFLSFIFVFAPSTYLSHVWSCSKSRELMEKKSCNFQRASEKLICLTLSMRSLRPVCIGWKNILGFDTRKNCSCMYQLSSKAQNKYLATSQKIITNLPNEAEEHRRTLKIELILI